MGPPLRHSLQVPRGPLVVSAGGPPVLAAAPVGGVAIVGVVVRLGVLDVGGHVVELVLSVVLLLALLQREHRVFLLTEHDQRRRDRHRQEEEHARDRHHRRE